MTRSDEFIQYVLRWKGQITSFDGCQPTHYPKASATLNTLLWSQTGSLYWSRWWYWGASAGWIALKKSLKHWVYNLNRRRHYSQTTETSLYVNSSIPYVIHSTLLMCSPVYTTHSPMYRWNGTLGPWRSRFVSMRLVICRTAMRMLLHSLTSTTARNTVLFRLFHLSGTKMKYSGL